MLAAASSAGRLGLDSLHNRSSGGLGALALPPQSEVVGMVRTLQRAGAVGTLVALGLLSPAAGRAETSVATSLTSEVDACNQAQYRMPTGATVQSFQLSQATQKGAYQFTCRVRWTKKAGAQPSGRPILFPSRVAIPLISL
jgi:hypothetical protein